MNAFRTTSILIALVAIGCDREGMQTSAGMNGVRSGDVKLDQEKARRS